MTAPHTVVPSERRPPIATNQATDVMMAGAVRDSVSAPIPIVVDVSESTTAWHEKKKIKNLAA